MTEEPDRANSRFSEPMKIRHPGAVARAFEQAGDLLPVLELVEQLADPLEVGGGGLVDQIGLAAHDQHRAAVLVLGPVGEARRDQLGRGAVDRLLAARGSRRAAAPRPRPASGPTAAR